jgi:hypothetical protein
MKASFQIAILLLVLNNSLFSQNIVEKLKEFYKSADFDCYEKKIQKDLHDFDSTVVKLLPLLNQKPHAPIKPGNIDLSKERKIFVLAVTLANTENYSFDDNIYDYLIIDSLRTFIVVCVDDKMNVTGFTDTQEPGSYLEIKDDFYFPEHKRRKQIKSIIKNINKENPEVILFCSAFSDSFMYIKAGKVYAYNAKKGHSKEFNEVVRECPDINLIRRSNFILWPLAKGFEEGIHSISYRLTGHTPIKEIRLCPASKNHKEKR